MPAGDLNCMGLGSMLDLLDVCGARLERGTAQHRAALRGTAAAPSGIFPTPMPRGFEWKPDFDRMIQCPHIPAMHGSVATQTAMSNFSSEA
jgi:hypothetical protein